MDKIRIYTPTSDGIGDWLCDIPMSKQAKIVHQLMGEYYIELPYNTIAQQPFPMGCYIEYDGWRFFLKKDAFPEPISGIDGYKYVLKFYAPQHHLEHRMFKWMVKEGNEVKCNEEVNFTLTTTLDEFGKLLKINIEDFRMQCGETGYRWTYAESGYKDTREVTFDGISCWEAMQRIAEAFGVECWVQEVNAVTGTSELSIKFGKCMDGNYDEYIREGEVVTRFPASKRGEDDNYGTRFYIYGGTKNIPDDYYENVTGGVTNHISEKRLHLPDGKAYLDVYNGEVVDTLPVGRIIERTIILEDIYPKNTSTVLGVEERDDEVIEGRTDKIYSISSTDSGFTGNDEEVLSTLGITFTSGALSGSSFDVRWNKPFENKFHIQPRVEGTSGSEQIVIPNEYLRPEVRDTFVLTGIKLPPEKVMVAEQDLLDKGRAKAIEYGSDTNVYDCKTNPVYCQNNKKNYRVGRRVVLVGGAFGEKGRKSRIQGFEKALWNEYDATYTIGDNNTYSRAKAIAKGYANNSGRIVRQESSRWENRAKALALSAGNADVTNQVNTLIGNDPLMSARDIAEDVVANDVPPMLNPLESRVSIIEGEDSGKSMRAVAMEVLGDVNIEGDLSAFITQINSNTSKIDKLVGSDKDKSARDIANDAIDKKTIALEDANTSQDDDGLVMAKDAIDYFGNKLTTAISNEVTRADKAYATKSDITRIDAEIDDIEESISYLEQDIAGHTAQISEIGERVTATNGTAEDALAKATNALADISALDASVKSSFNELGLTFDTLDGVITGINATATNALAKANEVDTEVDNLTKAVTANTKTIAEVDEKAINAQAKADFVEKRITANETLIGAFREDVEENTDDIAKLKSNNSTQDTKIAELERSVGGNRADIDIVLDNQSGLFTILHDLEDNLAKTDATANDAKSKADTNTSEITKIKGDIASLDTHIDEVGTKANDAYTLAEAASQKADTANNTINGVSTIVSTLRTTVEGHTLDIADIEEDVAENKAKIEAIEEDYISKGEAVDFATDLTGVVEATAEEFVYRPSAGEKSIRDKSAVIRRIKGNSVVWEQRLKSPSDEGADWHGYTSSMLTTEIQGREMRCTLTGASIATNPYQVGITGLQLTKGVIEGHVYMFCALVKVSFLNSSHGNHFAFEDDVTTWTLYPVIDTIDKWTFVSRIWQSTKTVKRTSTIRPPWAFTSANGAQAGDWYAVKDAMLFDLTAMFGAGNEPATVEEFRDVYNDAYYPYCEPVLRGMKTAAIKTVGFNLFDGSYARVIGGMTYIVSNYAEAYYSETKNGAQTQVVIEDGVYTPECSGYLHLTATDDATPCVHFQHSGVNDGKCAPYEEHTLELPEILRLFPNGMHAVGDVFDEINIDTYIPRCRYRDYVEGDENNADVLTDGVHTVAKLAEPIVIPLSEPITLDYYCEDWGTEEAISSAAAGSAPFRADIVYQFNAEGRIRDNSRNIAKLDKIVAPLQNIPPRDSLATQSFVLSTIPTEVATATERRTMIAGQTQVLGLVPNVIYDYTPLGQSISLLEVPQLYDGNSAYDNKWMVRVSLASSDALAIPFEVRWRDGIAPHWTAWGVCELTFTRDASNIYTFGEWKIYK